MFILAVLLLVILCIASYAINVVYMEFARTELQITTDIATRAACRALVDTGSKAEAQRSAQRLADENRVAGQVVEVALDDFEFAVATRYEEASAFEFSQLRNPNSVHLKSGFFQRSQTAIPMIFPTFGVPVSFRPFKEAIATQTEIDLAIVLDCSSSMMSSIGDPAPAEGLVHVPIVFPVPLDARWRVASRGIEQILLLFAESPQQEAVGLAGISSVALTDAGLSLDYSTIRSSLMLYQTLYTGGPTNLADGITRGAALLGDKSRARPWAARVLLLISDGKGNLGNDPLATARSVANEYVMIYTISLSSEADQDLMRQLAEVSRGQHFHARSASDFREVMAAITRRLPILLTQ
jgi:hypothetical protein